MSSTLPRRCKPSEFRRQIQSRSQNPIKDYTTAIAEKIEDLKTKCLIEGRPFTKELLRTNIRYGFAEHHCTIEDIFSTFLKSQQKKVDAGLSTRKNYRKYEIVRDLFFSHAGIMADANALILRQHHIIDFNTHLLSVYDTTTVAGMMQKLKTVFLHALMNKMIQENPFMGFKICRITKPLHTHIGRHTSACYLLNKGLSMEVVARILGHSTTKITRHYAKLLDTSVFDAVDKIMNNV